MSSLGMSARWLGQVFVMVQGDRSCEFRARHHAEVMSNEIADNGDLSEDGIFGGGSSYTTFIQPKQ